MADAFTAMAEIEAGHEAILGAARMRALTTALADIAAAADRVGALQRQ